MSIYIFQDEDSSEQMKMTVVFGYNIDHVFHQLKENYSFSIEDGTYWKLPVTGVTVDLELDKPFYKIIKEKPPKKQV